MTDPMNDRSANWSRGPLKVYFNRDDDRFFVPKYVPAMGWTINLAHPAAAATFVGLLVAVPLVTGLARLLHG